MSKTVYEQELTSIVMADNDNVATLLKDASAGESIFYVLNGEKQMLMLKQPVPFGHKIATKPIQKSEMVVKYGEVIGAATATIEPGEHVHVHNIEGIRGRGDKERAEKL